MGYSLLAYMSAAFGKFLSAISILYQKKLYLCRRIGADTRSGSLRLIGNQVQILDSPAAVSFTMHRDILKATETRASWEGSR